jgi:hypothetical protein
VLAAGVNPENLDLSRAVLLHPTIAGEDELVDRHVTDWAESQDGTEPPGVRL